MSDTTPAEQPAPAPADPAETEHADDPPAAVSDDTSTPDDDLAPVATDDPALAKARRQAAAYREKLRTTEADRDTLAEQVTAAEQAVIDWAITRAGIDPRLWQLSDVDLAELRTDAGTLDIDLVRTRAAQIHRECFPGGPDFGAGNRGSDIGKGTPSLADAFKPPGR
ncbi:hypothetical protein KIH27_08055 [Mycobacterium sp. M1]|uniref:Uncharacterized protein n=1 Tax=Mycolicibacter acidiphilus TaxID=2835306 RepID=A0ABS5RGY2_9MYCO|nr:hypothetical protein [Mycolicibacter acidiphilus]MBS9533540.1 hypothetical protein [Mycolicibacter acidiphilus]